MLELFTIASIMKLFSSLSFIIMLISVMVITGIMKSKEILSPIYSILCRYISNKKALLTCLTTLYGILPVPSRVTVTAALLDTMVDKNKDNSKMGILSYITTHHYYLWSPLEKSVLIAMSGLGLSYSAFMGYMVWPLLLSFVVICGYIIFFMKDTDLQGFGEQTEEEMSWSKRLDFLLLMGLILLNAFSVFPVISIGLLQIEGMTWSALSFASYLIMKHLPAKCNLTAFVHWDLIGFTTAVIIFGWVVGAFSSYIMAFIGAISLSQGLLLACLIGFASSFLLGSSSRYAAIAVILTKIFGIKYFILFYIIDYVGYLLSPAHKCLVIGQTYFKTKMVDYLKVILVLCITLLILAVIMVL